MEILWMVAKSCTTKRPQLLNYGFFGGCLINIRGKGLQSLINHEPIIIHELHSGKLKSL